MKFTLYYRGLLPPNGSPDAKHQIRRSFHCQLATLWKQQPLADLRSLAAGEPPASGKPAHVVHGFEFRPLVCEQLHLLAELEILLLRPEAPGRIVIQSGDIDNRIKTLLDSLRVPHELTALPTEAKPQDGETPFYCLLEDDALVTALSVRTDRLLVPVADKMEVVLVINVTTEPTQRTYQNIDL